MTGEGCGCGPCPHLGGCGAHHVCYAHRDSLDIPPYHPCPLLVVATLIGDGVWPGWAATAGSSVS